MYAGITLIITTTLTVIGVFILRIREPDLNRHYQAWGYPFTPMIFLIVNFWILFYSFKQKTFESIVGVAIILFSVIAYALCNRKIVK